MFGADGGDLVSDDGDGGVEDLGGRDYLAATDDSIHSGLGHEGPPAV